MGCKIEAIGAYLPETKLTNDDFSKLFDRWNPSKILRKTGIRQRSISAPDETAADMAVKAAETILDDENRKSIDFVLFCTQSPDYLLPTSACLIQERLGLRNDIGALDYNLGCSGYVYGLAMAKGFISAGVASRVLLLTAETYTKHIHPKDMSNRTIFGDGAAATIISRCEHNQIHEFSLGTDGSGAQNLIIPTGGMRRRYDPSLPEMEDEKGFVRSDNHLFMNGPEIFNFTIEAVPVVLQRTLDNNHLTRDDIDFFVFHQANKYMLTYLRDICDIPEDKMIIDMEETGNTVSPTIPIILDSYTRKGVLKPGMKLILLGFGVGYSWAGTIITL